MSTTTVSRPAADTVNHLADQATETADSAIRTTQRMAIDAIDALRTRSEVLRDKAARASDKTIVYIQDEPVKSVLIAAAAGAALMALAGLMGRSRH